VPEREQIGPLEVHHPSYPLLPKFMQLHGLLMFLGSYCAVRRLVRAQRFDAIDAHYVYPDGLAAVLLGKAFGLPVIVSARGTDINLFPEFKTIRPMIRWTLRQVAGGIGVCTALVDVMKQLGLASERAKTIGNGVDLSRFQPIDRHEARRKLGIRAEGPVVVAVGSLIERKGFQFLIPAVAAVRREFPALQAYVIGEGEFRPQLEQLIRQNQLEANFFLQGHRPNSELGAWYSAADVSCLVSSREGWPNVVLESMACGTPVLATNIWGVPEIITSPELGVIVEQNVENITSGLTSALRQSWSRSRLAEFAASRTWDTVADEMADWFERCLGNQQNAAGSAASA
jgi:glycosyltransferase involved in cell wall biosynthesis